ARTPESVSDTDASTLGVAGTTAVEAVEAVEPGNGSTVLIIGATGGIGSFAIQLATIRGAHVIATVRPGDEAFVTDLGGAEAVDSIAAVRERHPDGIDAVIDAVSMGGDEFERGVALVRKGGVAASTRGAAQGEEIDGVATVNANGNPARLRELARFVADGKVR